MKTTEKRFLKVLSAIKNVDTFRGDRLRRIIFLSLNEFENDPKKKMTLCNHVRVVRPFLYRNLELSVFHRNAKLEMT
jgi:hypothetical protein